jgi:hypothetical protein
MNLLNESFWIHSFMIRLNINFDWKAEQIPNFCVFKCMRIDSTIWGILILWTIIHWMLPRHDDDVVRVYLEPNGHHRAMAGTWPPFDATWPSDCRLVLSILPPRRHHCCLSNIHCMLIGNTLRPKICKNTAIITNFHFNRSHLGQDFH